MIYISPPKGFNAFCFLNFYKYVIPTGLKAITCYTNFNNNVPLGTEYF